MKHRKWLSVLLAVCMLIGCVPSSLAKEAGRRTLADTEMVTTVPAAEATEKAAPVIVKDGEPEVWVCGVQVTQANANNVLNDNKVKFNFETNTLTFTGKPARTALHEGALIYAQNMDLTIVTPNNGLSLNSGGDTGVKVLGGALTVNGKLSLTMIGDEVDACIYTDGALTVNGDLDVDSYGYEGAFGVKAMGPVTVTGSAIVFANEICIYCGSGDVTLQGGAYFAAESDGIDSIYHASCIYAADGGVDVKTVGLEFGAASYIIYANGPIRVREDLAVENTGGMGGGSGIVSESGGIVCDGNVNIAVGNGGICLSSRNAAEGIAVGGDAVLSNNYSGANSAAISAPGGPIHVTGSLTVNGYGATVVQAKGDISVGGNLDVKANSYNSSERRDNAIKSSDGSVNVTGYLKSSSVGLNVYAKNDITVGGDATVSGNVRNPQDYILRAETGKISVGGALTVTGQAPQSVYAAEAVTVNGNATVTNTADGSVGMESDGKITFVSGKWDVDAGAAALRAKEGIVIPAGFGITLPEGGRVLQKDGSYTVVEADLTAVAAHVIIEEKAPADGYYLIGGPVGWVVNETYRLFDNPHTAGEYYLDTVLEAGDEIKVVRVMNGEISDWYPDTAHNYNGITGNYVVDTDHAGSVTLYFRPDGNPDAGWQPFGGYFYIERDHLAEIEVVGGHGEAYLVKDGVNEMAVTVPRLMTVGIQTEPEQYYVLDKIELWKTHGEHDEPELIEELGSESFQMPDYDVIVKVYFKALTWEFVDFTWTGDDENGYTAAVANYECATDPQITRTVDAELNAVTHDASCTEPGSVVYTASISAEASPDGAPHSQEKSITLPVLGHAWGTPTYAWEQVNDAWTCTATRVCERDHEHVETESGTVTSAVTTEPGCETTGQMTYTATFTNEAFETQTYTEVIPELGHAWAAPSFTWTETADGYTASATFVCSRDETHTVTLPAEVTCAEDENGNLVYTASVTGPDEQPYTDTLTVERFTVEFVNDDGTVLQTGKYKAGELPVYAGETPVKEEVLFHLYTFTGWDKEIVPVTEAATYTARYDDLLYAKITGMTLALEGKIGINFWLKAPDEAAYAVIDFNGDEIRFELDKESSYWRPSSEQYRLPYSNVAIKMMMDPATIRVYDANDELMALVHNSKGLLEDSSWSFRVADWAYAILEADNSSEESIHMAKSLINLGNAAQNYFNYEVDDPANPDEYLKAETEAVVPKAALDPVIPSNAKSVLGYKYVKLNLEGDTEIRIFFDRQVTAKKGSKTLEVIKKGKEGWYVSVPGIAGVDLDVMNNIKVTYNGKTLTFKYGVLSFANLVLASETTGDAFKYLAKALYVYNEAAEIYFNKVD